MVARPRSCERSARVHGAAAHVAQVEECGGRRRDERDVTAMTSGRVVVAAERTDRGGIVGAVGIAVVHIHEQHVRCGAPVLVHHVEEELR
jgi:hypothetical protein